MITAGDKRIIILGYRLVIDKNAQNGWRKQVFEDTYAEFLMQSQYYNREKKYSLLSDIIHHDPSAEKLHYLVSAAAVGYLKQLNGLIPGIANNQGKPVVPFKNFRFEIINSDTKNKELHEVAISFFSEPLLWYDTLGDYLLISTQTDNVEEVYETELIEVQKMMNIHSIKFSK